MAMWDAIAQQIGEATSEPFAVDSTRNLGGGCINSVYWVSGGGRSFFVKSNDASLAWMFEAEAEGLEAMAATGTIRVPRPVCWGSAGGQAYLVLEHLEMGGSVPPERFGRELAAMHRSCADRFGWHRDNTIGSTAQPNGWMDDWIRFWRDRRLGFQLELAARNGAAKSLVSRGEELMECFPALFDRYTPVPSLLHGDLWGGNWASTSAGDPVIFDPATYYGDREADLAMTELFGGPGARFYDAYNAAWPVDEGYGVRRTLYNLYHILNHFNLFGGGYAAQADRMVGRLLSELR
ncbi:fructosamine kinase family protein [Thiohalomonas denitrificans]|uniref:Fructosamine-3-kinase n=1 Tax=Thiohalomonas denitrificans TaxID=415747 RepID=A0A1G5QZB1_9GAMM|nr:fructosamine kinase family protein [Thiohalomonas denitrificans]SCZ67056.1 Fructosamine-3-kinase [Thiohalomonas denitrificans]